MICKTHTVKDIIIHNHFLEMVLERFDIKFNLHNQSLECIAKSNQLELDFLLQILNIFDSEKPFSTSALHTYAPQVILDYLSRTHKYYLGKRLFEIEYSIQQIGKKNSNDYFLYSSLESFFSEFKTGLWEHIEMEEHFLFPHINFLLAAEKQSFDKKTLKLKLNNFSISKFIAEHNDDSETQLNEILSVIDYLYPETEHCFSPVCVLKKQLQGFEKDLHIHGLVEDEVLIPRLLRLETELLTLLH